MKLKAFARRPWVLTASLGVGLSALLGSGLIAAIVDSGSARDNTVESGNFNGVRYLELAAEKGGDEQCAAPDWQSDIGPQVVRDINLDNGDTTPKDTGPAFTYFCARTVQPGTYKLKVGLRAILDSETGCSAATTRREIDNDPDSCGTGLGELSKVLSVSFNTVAQGFRPQGDCNKYDEQGEAIYTPPASFTNLDVDHGGSSVDVCTITVAKLPVNIVPKILIDDASTTEQRNAAQSDKVQFNFYFTLERQ